MQEAAYPPTLELLTLIGIAAAVGSALHPKILSGALKLVGEPKEAVRRMGIPSQRLRAYELGLAVLTASSLLWALPDLLPKGGELVGGVFRNLSRPAVAALLFGATFGGLALLVSLAQHTLERRLGSGYASLLLGASAIGAALSVALMDSLHVLSLIAGAIVGAAIISLYRAVDGLPWYAATAGCVLGVAVAALGSFP